eukprot:GHVS01040003.1.p1 GENE.GHVS01040003.1~~GHVS01040003.1.p1  ORF type:complete len:110 (+),score=8.59 GHVS01040003.1:404-733(+)
MRLPQTIRNKAIFEEDRARQNDFEDLGGVVKALEAVPPAIKIDTPILRDTVLEGEAESICLQDIAGGIAIETQPTTVSERTGVPVIWLNVLITRAFADAVACPSVARSM